MVGIINSKEYKDYEAHEAMMPDSFKAELEPAETAEIGALINSNLLCIDNEDPSLPACLEDGRVRTVLNVEPKQYQWAPTALEAKKSTHYELGNYDAYMLSEAWQKRTKGEV